MHNLDLVQVTKEALWFVLLLSAPPIAVASVVGLLVAFFQAATQIQEQTFSYAVKFIAIALTLFLTASFVGGTLMVFSDKLLAGIAAVGR